MFATTRLDVEGSDAGSNGIFFQWDLKPRQAYASDQYLHSRLGSRVNIVDIAYPIMRHCYGTNEHLWPPDCILEVGPLYSYLHCN